MLAHAQETLYGLEKQEAQLQTKVDMEQAIEHDLTQRLQQLDDDVDQLRSMHATSDELIEMERTTVAQLEQEYAMLLTHEHEAKHECDVLTIQAEKQKLQLKDIRTKSAYLEFVSRIPMKKHLEEKKIRDQEEGLLLKVCQVDDENALLEAELARLDKQLAWSLNCVM
uniref:Uncharacterized protein n=1 Tax=Globisporangium ultimum (strain ATCC 200006 / CBS 805.95 / DAOM BR144) TaxID=431595 RepID=K3WMH0_GLOUD